MTSSPNEQWIARLTVRLGTRTVVSYWYGPNFGGGTGNGPLDDKVARFRSRSELHRALIRSFGYGYENRGYELIKEAELGLE